MALRAGHGNGRGKPRIEVTPVNELPKGVEVQMDPSAARALRRRLARSLALLDGTTEKDVSEAMKPYFKLALKWRESLIDDLALRVGGGVVGPSALAILSTATMQFAMSRYYLAVGMKNGNEDMMNKGSAAGERQRQNLLAVYELVAREAKQRATTVKPETLEQALLLESPS